MLLNLLFTCIFFWLAAWLRWIFPQRSFLFETSTMWAPTGYKWICNLSKMPCKWLTRVIALLIGVISPFIIGRGPTFFSDSHPLKLQPVLSQSDLGYTCHILPQQQICVLYIDICQPFNSLLPISYGHKSGGMPWILNHFWAAGSLRMPLSTLSTPVENCSTMLSKMNNWIFLHHFHGGLLSCWKDTTNPWPLVFWTSFFLWPGRS